MANQYLIKGVKGKVGGYISEDNPMPVQDSETYWKDAMFDYTSGDLDYKGLSVTHKAATDAGDLWYVWKYTWVGTNPTRIEGPIIGNWDDRAGMAWA